MRGTPSFLFYGKVEILLITSFSNDLVRLAMVKC